MQFKLPDRVALWFFRGYPEKSVYQLMSVIFS
jgi:hypothetical protein